MDRSPARTSSAPASLARIACPLKTASSTSRPRALSADQTRNSPGPARLDRRDRRVNLVSHRALRVSGPAHDDVDASLQQPEQVRREQIDRRRPVDVQQ